VAGPTNTQFALGVHLLTLIADHPGGAISAETMSESTGANPVHSRRVLGELRRAGLVASRSGPHGGWELTRAPEAISLADVWDVLRGDQPLLGVHDVAPDCPVGRGIRVALTEVDRRVVAAVRDQLVDQTIGDLTGQVPAAMRDDRAVA
jgi:Rrf2 family protein